MLLAMSSLLESRISAYLNGTRFNNHFTTRNWERYKTIGVADVRVYQYEEHNASFVVKFLVGGACPFCDSINGYARNVCIQKFGNDCFVELLKSEFPEISKVLLLHSTDKDILRYSRELNIRVKPLFKMDAQYSYIFLIDVFMSKHPMVDGQHNFLVRRGDPGIESVPLPDSPMTPNEFICRYKVCWIIDDYTKVIRDDGLFLEGMLPIVENMDRLLGDFKVVRGPRCFFLCGEGEKCFNENMFRIFIKNVPNLD